MLDLEKTICPECGSSLRAIMLMWQLREIFRKTPEGPPISKASGLNGYRLTCLNWHHWTVPAT